MVTDPIPTGQTLISATSSAGTCTPPAPATGTVSCAVGTLGPRRAGHDHHRHPGGGERRRPARDRTPRRCHRRHRIPTRPTTPRSAAVTIAAAADIAVSKTAATNPVVAGTGQTYTIVVSNNGPSDAQDVTLTDPAVAGLTVRSASTTQGTCAITAGAVARSARSPPPGSRITVAADVAADRAAGPLTNTATATSTAPRIRTRATTPASSTVTVRPVPTWR